MVLLELLFVDDAVDGPYYAGAFHFVDRADVEEEYSYDANGNMTKDLNRGIEEIRYNFLNLPSKISFTEKNAYIRNMYDANGHKFKMITYANIPLVIGRAAPAKASAKAASALTCLVYNIFRYVQINTIQPIIIVVWIVVDVRAYRFVIRNNKQRRFPGDCISFQIRGRF